MLIFDQSKRIDWEILFSYITEGAGEQTVSENPTQHLSCNYQLHSQTSSI
jgi:hypothetical protein